MRTRNYFLVFYCSVTAALIGCGDVSQDSESSKISIQFPDFTKLIDSDSHNLLSDFTYSYGVPVFQSQNVSALSTVTEQPPLSITEFSCFGLNVFGPGIPKFSDPNGPGDCFDKDGAYAGILGGLIPATGGTIELDVPSGKGRGFQAFAMKSTIGCPAVKDILSGKVNADRGFSFMYELGRKSEDIFSDSALSVPIAYIPNHTRELGCGSHNDSCRLRDAYSLTTGVSSGPYQILGLSFSKIAQTMTTLSFLHLGGVKLNLGLDSAGSSSVYVSVQNVDGSGNPNGNNLIRSKDFQVTSTSAQDFIIPFERPMDFGANQTIAIVLNLSSGIAVRWHKESTPSYSAGQDLHYNGIWALNSPEGDFDLSLYECL